MEPLDDFQEDKNHFSEKPDNLESPESEESEEYVAFFEPGEKEQFGFKKKWNSLKKYRTNFVFLVGTTGSGKSTFIASLLSQLKRRGLLENRFGPEVSKDKYNADGLDYFHRLLKLFEKYQVFPERTAERNFEYGTYKIKAEATGASPQWEHYIPTTFIELGGELIRSLNPNYATNYGSLRQEMINFLGEVGENNDVSIQVLFLSELTRLEDDWDILDTFLSLFHQDHRIKLNIGKFHFAYILTKWDQVQPYSSSHQVEDIIRATCESVYDQMKVKIPKDDYDIAFLPFSVTDESIEYLTDHQAKEINSELRNDGLSFEVNTSSHRTINKGSSFKGGKKFDEHYVSKIGDLILANLETEGVIEVFSRIKEDSGRRDHWTQRFWIFLGDFLGVK